jgi:hypothetical protein
MLCLAGRVGTLDDGGWGILQNKEWWHREQHGGLVIILGWVVLGCSCFRFVSRHLHVTRGIEVVLGL